MVMLVLGKIKLECDLSNRPLECPDLSVVLRDDL